MRPPLAGLILAAGVAVTLPAPTPAARPQDKDQQDRAELLRAFDDMVAANKQREAARKGLTFDDRTRTFFDIKKTPVGPVGNMVKVWAELCNDQDQPTREYVSLVGTEWKPRQSFHLYVQPAAPVIVYLFVAQDAKRPRQLLPNEDPATRQPLPIGVAAPLGGAVNPFVCHLDDDLQTEKVDLSFVLEGAIEANDDPLSFFDVLRRRGGQAGPLTVARPERQRSANPADVAAVVLLKTSPGRTNRSGLITVEFPKKR